MDPSVLMEEGGMKHPNVNGTTQQQQDRASIRNAKKFTKIIQQNLDKATQQMVLPKETTMIIPRVQRTRSERQDYEPRIISIGPYFWGNRKLRSMDKQKRRCVAEILKQNDTWSLQDYTEKLLELLDEVRTSYTGVFNLSDQDFVEMMLLDGCFIAQYFRDFNSGGGDQLINDSYMRRIIEHDMLLLQNQIPFSVVQSIFDLVTEKNHRLSDVILNFCNHSSFIQKTPFVNDAPSFHSEPAQHLLHLYHRFIIFEPEPRVSKFHNPLNSIKCNCLKVLYFCGFCFPSSSNKKSSKDDVLSIPSATVLASAGIKFKRKEGFGLLHVSFHEGNMEVPSFLIDCFTKSLIKNLVAFEKFNPIIEPQFTDYVKFLDHIINNSEDVTLLRKSSIIDHSLGSDEEVANLFNGISESTFHHQPDYLKRIYKDVDKHFKVRRHKWWASFKHRYFGSPWSIIKLVAGVIFLVLAFLQTFFTIYPYYHPHT